MEKGLENKEMYSIQIETAKPEDALGIAQIQEETWLATYPNEEFGVTEEDIRSKKFLSEEKVQRWVESIEKQNLGDNRTLVAKEGDKILGFCVVFKDKEFNVVSALYISPNRQGEGLGKRLLEEGLNWLGDEKDIILDVASYNTQAIEFYKRMGFEIWKEEDPPLATKLPSGGTIPGIEMIKRFERD